MPIFPVRFPTRLAPAVNRRRRTRSGYSLIEVLIALVILMVLVQVIGSSLVTVLTVEQRAAEVRELTDVSQLLLTDSMLGIKKDVTLTDWPYPDWRVEYDLVTVGRGDTSTKYHEWAIRSRTEREPRLKLYAVDRGE